MARLQLHWLGSPAVALDGQPLHLEMRKTLALLAYLSLSPQPPTRETLSALFWPEFDQQHALSNLRRNLASLAKSIPPGFLYPDRDRIEFRMRDEIQVDVAEFHRLLVQTNTHKHPVDQVCGECIQVLEDAVRLYRGDFFEGFNLKDCPEFDDWQFFQREGLRAEYAGALEKLALYYQQTGEWEKAITHARSWLALDRLHEPAQRVLMKLYFLAGQKSAAVRQFEECKRILEQELGQPPEPATLQLFDEIRKESNPELRPERAPVETKPPVKTYAAPLTKTKFFIPKVPRTFLHRPRLVSKLNHSVKMPLTLISASAGFGKTTLLAEWAAQSPDKIGWVSLDRNDNNQYRIMDYIVNAIRNALPETNVGSAALDLLHSSNPAQISVILGSLINDLIPLPHNLILVLDDYHQIDSPAAHEAILFLIDHRPENLHLVISTRSDPPLPIARLRANILLSDLRTDDLRFTSEETQLFLIRLLGFPLSAQDLDFIGDKVEGWVAGIQLAALAIQSSHLTQSSAELHRFIRAFKGSQRYILDYLVEEVLNHQPDEIRAFLLKTSILTSMCGPLCDSILTNDEGSDSEGDGQLTHSGPLIHHPSASILDSLERSNLFLVPLDEERIWYRYHHLFADLLFQRLNQIQPEDVKKLNLRAARWHEQNGYLENAIGYALKAKDYQLATRLMDQIKVNLWSQGEVRNMQHWLDTLPEELIREQPELSLDYAACLTLAGYFDEAEKWLQFTEDGYGPTAPPDRQATLRAKIMVPLYRSASARFHGDYSQAVALCEAALAQVPSSEIRYQGVSLLFLGQAHFFAGNTDTAEQVISEAVGMNLATVHTAAYIGLCHDFAQIRVLQGRLHEARKIYEQVHQSIQERGIIIHAGTEYSGLGDLKREWNELTAATLDIQKGIELAEISDHVFFLLDVYLARVRLAISEKDWESAWDYLKKAEVVVRRCPTSIEIENIGTWQARIYLAQGNLAQAEIWAEKKVVENAVSFELQKEFELLTLARIWLALGKTDRAAALLGLVRLAAQSAGRYGHLLEAQMLQALVELASGKQMQAVEELSPVLAQAEPERYARLFVDEGAPMHRLLTQWLACANPGPLYDYAVRLLSQFDT